MNDPTKPGAGGRRTGRRAGHSGTRDAILDAARDLFAEHGYEGASMRAIAAAAGVDAALIRHFFGDKAHLFAATMADRTVIPQRFAEAFAGPREALGRRVSEAYLRLWEDEATAPMLLGLARSAMTTGQGAELLIEAIGGRMLGVARAADLGEVEGKAMALAAAHLFGVAVARNVLKVPVLASQGIAELAGEIAPAIQGYLNAAAPAR